MLLRCCQSRSTFWSAKNKLKAMSPSVLIHGYSSTDMHIQGAHYAALRNLNAAVPGLHTINYSA